LDISAAGAAARKGKAQFDLFHEKFSSLTWSSNILSEKAGGSKVFSSRKREYTEGQGKERKRKGKVRKDKKRKGKERNRKAR
jgi:hypothetical protein